ncbi:toll/interleukin-1 receptor domain-containing protein [Falsihalocynthiibacter sp. SS001]|uniref:toll/interleukin-1 receptor domain-containing protein n=1 Tax=Falsihalocynthiibacter sp. SS001 TaxID=3349698 RepID=UPI0036D30ED8
MIFLSHNHGDKPVVEPIALRLRDIFGEDQVFYDSWSIQPGDGVIDKMNGGLTAPKYVFFFVSERSLQSPMVKVEWQNALLKATKGQCKLIPVKVGNVEMPPILLQNLYIDMFTQGLEVALNQIVSVVQGKSSFAPEHKTFSNLTWTVAEKSPGEIEVTISASHFMDPITNFIFLSENSDDELDVMPTGSGMFQGGFIERSKLQGSSGAKFPNGFHIKLMGETIQPKFPISFALKSKFGALVSFEGVMQLKGQGYWEAIPRATF